MKHFYHATRYSNLDSIMKGGIIPGIDGITYLAETQQEAYRFICIRVWDEPILVLEVELDETRVEETFDHAFAFFKARAFGIDAVIPPEEITNAWIYAMDLGENS